MDRAQDRPTRFLVADDNVDTCRYVAQHLQMEPDLDAQVDVAHDRDEALRLIQQSAAHYDVVVADLWMPDRDGTRDTDSGLKILQAGRAQTPPAEVIIITGNSSAETALRASLTGAREYILKPIDYERLMRIVRHIIAERQLTPAADGPEGDDGGEPIVGASPAIIDVMKTLGRVAPTDADVLIEGESGVGKELVARAIHANSPRADEPFVIVNCSAIPATLIEAELFGIGRRVATEVDAREGKFVEANGGTLFLDEIGDLALDVQPKLLRAIEEKEIPRVGGVQLRSDARIVAATNQHLDDAVQAGTFRKDLYYRLNGASVRVPALRERRDDVPLLAEYFLRRHARRAGKPILGFDQDVVPRLAADAWPGNVRQLKNAVETAVLNCPGKLVRLEDFQSDALGPQADPQAPAQDLLQELSSLPLHEAVAEFERRMLVKVLREADGNVTRAAEALGMGRTALHRKLRQRGVHRDD